ncbi:uncharacterized protein LOC121871214 [Homarus americanus]|nr:uncharacterized protein LOC121871214 [Homarus americanus]
MAPLTTLVVLGLFLLVSCEDCAWNKDKNYPTKNPPLILDASFKLVLPVLEGEDRMVRLSAGSKVTLACPGSSLTKFKSEAVKATCIGAHLLAVDGKAFSLKKLRCRSPAKSTIRRELGRCGAGDLGHLQAIGFDIPTLSKFYEVIRVCYDNEADTTLYSEHIIHGANILAKDVDLKRPPFKASSGFFNVSANTCYTKANQLKLMETLLGDSDLAKTMIDSRKQFYLARGHMAPDADFVTEAEQDATYYYINAVPQWQAFNNGNWKFLEFATRRLAVESSSSLKVYSGGWGVLELADINNNAVDIYLGLVQKKALLPAPAITWKVVYEESRQRAVAIVGVNNPHLKEPPTKLCPDLCNSLAWVDFDVNNLVQGFTYCCTVDDLRQAVPHVPDLGDVDLLTIDTTEGPGGC